MLICRRGDWRVESDGYVSSADLRELAGLREVEAFRAREAERETARLAERVRELKRRAVRRGYAAGRRNALREYVVPPAAASFAARCLEERLAGLALNAVTEILGELPADATLHSRLRRCIGALRGQQVISVRVSADDCEQTQRIAHTLERELDLPLFMVLADAGLPPHSLVVETESGVIDGSLALQLRVLERGMRDAIGLVLNEYRYIDGESARMFDVIESGLRDVIQLLGQHVEARHGGEVQ
ncbi:flagellar biosynthesis protein [Paraburkholderia sp. Tr-20389]|uniref:FliH/SctL family protein n=1 Tax=Paraburkholderia sp. Tr-20389 TaxID=2703903 RepID=UPI001981A9D6|nr:FliH/SctL family protein [Paraburkholderia sp. Tr-20389]MBN3754979.1 flagellar biosynthesis protein [Paraburkholderia sp. Tr-20389]